MNMSLYTGLLSQILRTTLSQLTTLLTKPAVADADIVDCFAADKQGGEDQNALYNKLGLDKKTARLVEKADLRGEIVPEKNPGTEYAKLLRDGHIHNPRDEEAALLDILNTVENGEPAAGAFTNAKATASPAPAAPTPGEIRESLIEIEGDDEEENSRDGSETFSGEEEDDSTEQAESPDELIPAKAFYPKADSFV